MISIRALCGVLLLCFVLRPACAAGPIEIWSYAFVTDNPKEAVGYQEPISGHGSAIFKMSNEWREGPMWSNEKTEFRLKFKPADSGYIAVMKVKGLAGDALNFTGKFDDTVKPDSDGCLREIRLTSGSNYVLLRRVVADC